MNFNLLTGRANNKLIKYNDFYLHEDALPSFIDLQKQAKADIGADLQIVSSFRSFDAQEKIWNAKALGKRKLLDTNGDELVFDDLSQDEVLKSIMRWSAIPGASRHHWGSDFDVYDANKISKDELKLVSSESDPGGVLFDFHRWLDERLQNNCPFFRPYDKDLGGVNVEKWHLSFFPIADELLKEYSIDIFKKNIDTSQMLLKDHVMKDLDFFYEKFVKNICPPL